MTHGLVSTIIAVYNRPHLLTEAVDSVLAQTYRPIEIVIVDDGSTDDTPAVAQALVEQHPDVIRFQRQSHVHYTAAWNAGMSMARGEFIQFLDSDDLLLPDKFAMQVGALQARPECAISYCYVHEHPIDQPRSGVPARHTANTFDELFPQLLTGKIWPSPSPLFRREVIDRTGEFLDVRVQPDWEWECRAAALRVKLHHCQAFLGETRGTHEREGRSKGGVPPGRSADYALVLDRIASHARRAGVADADLALLAPKLFTAAKLCAVEGCDAESTRALHLARQLARPADRIAHDPALQPVVRAATLPVRAARYAYRRSREASRYFQGRRILRDYSAHYRQARQAYPPNGNVPARAHGESILADGVAVLRPSESGVIALPPRFQPMVERLAQQAAMQLSATNRCRFVPPLSSMSLPGRVEMIPEVKRGAVITAQLLDPFALDGLSELCEPLMSEIEHKLYGAHALVDKVYVYRSLVSSQTPRASWLWHYDNHPREMLKVMIYLTDVDETTAPFEYLRGPDGRAALGRPLAPRYGDSRLTPQYFDRLTADGYQAVRVTGPRGTMLLFDDNIVHRATLAQSAHRDVVVFQVRPATFKSEPRIDPRWTGSFLHHDLNLDPADVTPRLKA